MVGILLLVFFIIFLSASFYKASVTLFIWQIVFFNVRITSDYTLNSLIGIFVAVFFASRFFSDKLSFADFPFKKSYSILVLSFILAGIPLKIGYIGKYTAILLLPIIVWFAKDKIRDFWKYLYINLIIFASIITSIGLIELVLGYNPVALWLDFQNIMTFREVGETYVRYDMYRCRSITAWCSTYGVACAFMLICFLFCSYYRRFDYKQRLFIIPLLICLFVGIISSGTRSVYICLFLLFLPLLFKYITNFKYIVLVVIAVCLAYNEYAFLFDSIIDSIVNHEDAGGSSVELRMRQYSIAYRIFMKHPIFGGGIDAIASAMKSNPDLLGAESCIFIILVDRGLFGIWAYVYFNYEMVYFLFTKTKYKILALVPISLFVGKIMSAFVDIYEPYCVFWIIIMMKAIDDFYCEHDYMGKSNI